MFSLQLSPYLLQDIPFSMAPRYYYACLNSGAGSHVNFVHLGSKLGPPIRKYLELVEGFGLENAAEGLSGWDRSNIYDLIESLRGWIVCRVLGACVTMVQFEPIMP